MTDLTNLTANNQLQKLLDFVWNNSIYQEVWKEIPNTDCKYFVSNRGRILSLCYNQPRLLKQFICGDGYYYVDIHGSKRVNRLVALAFIDNPENKEIVHHIDANRLNNDIDNLQWATAKENRQASIERLKGLKEL